MDPRHFDTLTRALSEAGPRRGLLGLLATLPLLGGVFALLNLDETEAKGRRKRRKKAHKHGQGRRRKHHQKCQADSKSTTCAGGKCGPIVNNCKKTVDCGSCDCDSGCETCFTCQSGPNTPGACVVDPNQAGDPCDDGGTCCDDGCADLDTDPDHCGVCGNHCNPARTCNAGTCVCPGACDKNFVQQPDCTCACPADFELVNGGCFKICNDLDGLSPDHDCPCLGSMVGSINYLCADRSVVGPTCRNFTCPAGMACNGGAWCRTPC